MLWIKDSGTGWTDSRVSTSTRTRQKRNSPANSLRSIRCSFSLLLAGNGESVRSLGGTKGKCWAPHPPTEHCHVIHVATTCTCWIHWPRSYCCGTARSEERERGAGDRLGGGKAGWSTCMSLHLKMAVSRERRQKLDTSLRAPSSCSERYSECHGNQCHGNQ